MSVLIDTARKLREFPQPTLPMNENILYEEIFYRFNCFEDEFRKVKDYLFVAFRGMNSNSNEQRHIARELKESMENVEADIAVFQEWSTHCFNIDYFPASSAEIDVILNRFYETKEKVIRFKRQLRDMRSAPYWSDDFLNTYNLLDDEISKCTSTITKHLLKGKELYEKKEADHE